MTYTIYTDGGARGNPGPAATGIIIQHENGTTVLGSFLGKATNNVAEYTAVKQAFEFLFSQPERGEVSFFLDSELVVKQLTGIYKIKDATLRQLASDIHKQIEEWGSNVTFTHIPRKQNKEADAKVNEVLDLQSSHV